MTDLSIRTYAKDALGLEHCLRSADQTMGNTHQVLIASYARDFPFLEHCLWSLKEFCVGFLPPVISVSSEDFSAAVSLVNRVFPEAAVKVRDGRHGYGFMRAQLSMMEGDLLCSGDVVWLVGSDCFVSGPLRPDEFYENGKPVMWTNSYAHLLKHSDAASGWREGTARIIGRRPDKEFMRRLPLLYPKELFSSLRNEIEGQHGAEFDNVIYREWDTHRDVSESNLLGEHAWARHRDLYSWVDLDPVDYKDAEHRYPNPMLQFWSHGGLDRPCDRDANFFGGSTKGKTPREIIDATKARYGE